jgi:hypothetical protein
MVVTYQDKKTNKVNYLEFDFLINENSANKCATPGCKKAPGVVSAATGTTVKTQRKCAEEATAGDQVQLDISGDNVIGFFA